MLAKDGGAGHPDHAHLGQLKRNTAAVGSARAKANWLLRNDLRVARWLLIDSGVPYGADGRNGLRAGHLVRGCHRRIGLARAKRDHHGRTYRCHTKTRQREPEAAPKTLFRRAIAELGMEVLGRRHGDTPLN
jgi:hypothetical protein